MSAVLVSSHQACFGGGMQVDECAGALIRAASRAEEDLAPALPPRKRAYLFGCLGPAAARTLMWVLPEMPVRVLPASHRTSSMG